MIQRQPSSADDDGPRKEDEVHTKNLTAKKTSGLGAFKPEPIATSSILREAVSGKA